MPLYFAYRTGYKSNTRHLKIFEFESILEFFQKNWDKILDEENDSYIELFGDRIYGFPIWTIDENPKPKAPSSISELIKILKKYVYNNEIKGDENCIQVFTDDDEIELAWYIFTESYKKYNLDTVSIWLHDSMPVSFGEDGVDMGFETNLVSPKIEGKGKIYFGSCPIHDGGNLSGLGGIYQINGIRLPELVGYLKNHKIDFNKDNGYEYGIQDLKYIQTITKKLDAKNITDVFNFFNECPLERTEGKNLDNLTFEQIRKIAFSHNSELSSIQISDHFCELGVYTYFDFHHYFIIFDDLWVEKNLKLARSIANFVTSPEI